MNHRHRILLIFSIILLFFVIWLFEITDIDRHINDNFFDNTKKIWLIPNNDTIYGKIFYKGIKGLLILVAVGILTTIILSYRSDRYKKYRYRAIFLFLCMAIIPSFISFLKHTTNVYPPWDLKIYNGTAPYVKLIEKYPKDFLQKDKPQGYPAGHASGGFSLLCFYFVLKKRWKKNLSLIIWMLAGWSMGIYQMLRGAHFLSHTIVTNILSIIITLIIYNFFSKKIKGELYEISN
ncbi:MAG: phosphoesterase [Candidatus Muiribacterium halophilum]|uniref:Phosphoesterase n=1 Tax=Muiribacterium halophilum TaxID=2053465 RepID=A0A2N5ZIQ4_MUIH1|nr:MAG: phosphoesterase [Candidatus Muirbacterium halophilum]